MSVAKGMKLWMDIQKADVALSIAGRDKGRLFFVLDIEGEFAFIADGRIRHLEKPKKKKRKHLSYYSNTDSEVKQRILNGGKITNSLLRKTLHKLENPVG